MISLLRKGAVLLALWALWNAPVAAGNTEPQTSNAIQTSLQRVANMRIFWGHQSVGGNVLTGLKQLAESANVPLNIVERPNAESLPPGTFAHLFIGENRDPLGKLQAFDKALGKNASDLDVAMIKFCYLDIDENTDVTALFRKYQETINRVQDRYPHLRIVHVTTPLTIIQVGPKAWIKRMLGRAPYGVRENQHREAFNQLLRQNYGAPNQLFDLAKLEATGTDGSQTAVEWKGEWVPALTPDYTEDGSHLNASAKVMAAKALITVLAKPASN